MSQNQAYQIQMSNKDLRSQTDVNLDRFVFRFQREFAVDTESLEFLINRRRNFSREEEDAEEAGVARQKFLEKRQKMIKDLFEAAAKTLTDVQYQFFTSYYVFGLSETQIAINFGVTQPYVSIVLQASHKKIKKRLKLL